MSVDLKDPNIRIAYDAIVKLEPTNWLLLHYGQTRDKLTLLASGDGGIREMQASVPPEDIVFGFCREQEGERHAFAMITYTPEDSVSAVRRARALVHTRSVAMLFKAHQKVVSARTLDQMSTAVVRYKLGLSPATPGGVASPLNQNRRSKSLQTYLPVQKGSNILHALGVGHARRSASESVDPHAAVLSSPEGVENDMPAVMSDIPDEELPPPPPDHDIVTSAKSIVNDEPPPPPPPKDIPATPPPPPPNYQRPRARTESEFVPSFPRKNPRISEDYSVTEILSVDLDADATNSVYSRMTPPASPTTHAQRWAAQSRARWASDDLGDIHRLSPDERAQRRIETERKRAMEEQQALRDAAERQARLKFEREESLREHMSDEERRKAILAEDLRRASAERRLREQQWKDEEEERRRIMEERKRLTRERKLQEARLLQDRIEQDRTRAEQEAKATAEKKRWADQQRAARLREVQERFSGLPGSTGIVLAGWLSVQTTDQLTWRRRWFEMASDSLVFMKDPSDKTVLDTIDIAHVEAIREWQDGFEELKAIPTAFAIEFNDGQGPWSAYSDTLEDKDVFMGMLIKIASL